MLRAEAAEKQRAAAEAALRKARTALDMKAKVSGGGTAF